MDWPNSRSSWLGCDGCRCAPTAVPEMWNTEAVQRAIAICTNGGNEMLTVIRSSVRDSAPQHSPYVELLIITYYLWISLWHHVDNVVRCPLKTIIMILGWFYYGRWQPFAHRFLQIFLISFSCYAFLPSCGRIYRAFVFCTVHYYCFNTCHQHLHSPISSRESFSFVPLFFSCESQNLCRNPATNEYHFSCLNSHIRNP